MASEIHFYDRDVPYLLAKGFAILTRNMDKIRLLDLGCGSGRLIYALYNQGWLKNTPQIVGVDISEHSINHLVKQLPFVKGIVSDASEINELASNHFDFIICSQLIEHVQDDMRLIDEIYRLLKHEGLAYISTVMKKRGAFYFYRTNGAFRLSPSHIREYASKEQFLKLIEKQFRVIDLIIFPTMFSIADLIIRTLMKKGIFRINLNFFQDHAISRKIRQIKIPIFRYSHVAVLIRKE